jgi:hypothetical protein
MAENLSADHGWGPWLVDVAMEFVTRYGAALFPHNVGIVPDAKLMWTVYHANRNDVTHVPFSDQAIAALRIEHQEPELRCKYTKQPAILLQLEAANKIWADPDSEDSDQDSGSPNAIS